jgi:nucleotide-binding universal stress UspA family protein
MYKKILVPLDGSKLAEGILPHVEQLAKNYQSTVILMQVIELMPIVAPAGQPDMTFYQVEFDRRRQIVEDYLREIQSNLNEKGIETKYAIIEGAVVASIIEIARQEDVDLIAMASHGRGGLAQVFYGSVAAGLLQRVDRPLLLIRAKRDG